MKYLIDPNYITPLPYSLLSDTLAYITGFEFIRDLNLTYRLNKKAFLKFDGADFNLVLSGLFEGEQNKPRWKKIEKIKEKDWNMYAFHGGHEEVNKQFKHMETNLAEDTDIIRQKIRSQIQVAKELANTPNPIIVYHPGLVQSKPKDFKATLKNLEFALKEAGNNMLIVIENMPREDKGYYIGADYRDLKQILKDINSPNLGVCFDWGHANNYSKTFAKENNKNYEYVTSFSYHKEIIEELNEKIIYAHIHYNKNHLDMDPNKGEDDHMPLTRIKVEEVGRYRQTIRDLVKKTSIKKYEMMTLELIPKKVFWFYTIWPTGSTRKEQYKSLEFLKVFVGK